MRPLPVETFADEIKRRVRSHRVTVISGETGCGKSSRVPMMIMEEVGERARLMVAQPRRLAAHSLHRRACELGYGDLVGLRMSGSRVEGPKTRLWYATTGYLARLVGHAPESFGRYTHIIIDECHERSVDADVLCLLCRRLLAMHSKLRVVLMSATAHNEMLRGYFARTVGWEQVSEPLHVGGRRYPIQTTYVEDVMEHTLGLPERLRASARRLCDRCGAINSTELADGTAAVPQSILSTQLEIAIWLARLEAYEYGGGGGGGGCEGEGGGDGVGGGGAVLVFVPGIAGKPLRWGPNRHPGRRRTHQRALSPNVSRLLTCAATDGQRLDPVLRC